MDEKRRPEGKPDLDEPVFKPNEPASLPPQPEIGEKFDFDTPAKVEPGPKSSSASSPDASQEAKPVFLGEVEVDAPTDPESGLPPGQSLGLPSTPPTDSLPKSPPSPALSPASIDDEPVFGPSSDNVDSPYLSEIQDPQDNAVASQRSDSPAFASSQEDSTADEEFRHETSREDAELDEQDTGSTGWVHVAADSEIPDDPQSDKEYSYFEETPSANAEDSPPAQRKLGRTGPVWILGSGALVIVAGLVWFIVSQFTGTAEDAPLVDAEPTVQQAVAATAPAQSPTITPGPTAAPTPILLPINANVRVGDTDGQGVLLRKEPGRLGEFAQILAEGTVLVVLDADPESAVADYPVVADGYIWYRMRVIGLPGSDGEETEGVGEEDPLIGWSASEFFVVADP